MKLARSEFAYELSKNRMTLPSTSCPYCNALVAPPQVLPANRRLLCPRCGEMFAYRPGDPQAHSAAPPPAPAPVDESVPIPVRFSNRMIAGAILVVMATMAAVGLYFALQTEVVRREHDSQLGKPSVISVPLFLKVVGNLWIVGLIVLLLNLRTGGIPSDDLERRSALRRRWLRGIAVFMLGIGLTVSLFSEPMRRRNTPQPEEGSSTMARTTRPNELDGLRFLPEQCNIVGGVNVVEAFHQPASKQLLEQLKIGSVELSGNAIENWIGLRWEEIDHIVFGLQIDVLRPTLVVRTRTAIDAAAVTARLKAARIPESTHKDRYRFRLGRSALEPALWLHPDGRTLIVTLTPKDLDAIAVAATQATHRLLPPLQGLLQERMSKTTPVWLAGHSEHWDQSLLQFWLANLPRQEQETLGRMRTFGVWLDFASDVSVNAAADCADAATAAQLREAIHEWAKTTKLDAKAVQAENWVSAQGHASVESIARAFASARNGH